MRITRFGAKGIVFYAMLICSFFAAPYLNLFFMLLAFSTVLAVLSAWWAHRNITGITGQFEEIAPMPAGASQLARLHLDCTKRSRHYLSVEIEVGSEFHTMRDNLELEPGGQRVDVMVPGLPRGVHEVTSVVVTSLYPFGMLQGRRRVNVPEPITVYPAPADLTKYRERSEIAGRGLGGSLAAEMGPAGLREFRDGDELRNVHWKASARRSELVVKEFEGDAAPGMEVLLDLRAQGDELEEALSLVVAFALECKENKELFTLRTQEHSGTYGKGHTSFDQLLAYLAGVHSLPANCAPPAVSPTVLRLPLASGLPSARRDPSVVREEARC